MHCMALRSVAVSDSRTLLAAWSREQGRLTLAFPAGAGREARRRRALSSPLALFEGCVQLRPGKEILSMKDFAPSPGSPALAPPDAIRNLVAAFLAEVLDSVLRRSAPDASLTDYLFDGARRLAALAPGDVADFHLLFIFGLTRPAGIWPDMSAFAPGAVFDMRDACFRNSPPMHADFLAGDDAALFPALADALAGESRLALSRRQRRVALAHILDYLSLHIGGLGNLKSLPILQEM